MIFDWLLFVMAGLIPAIHVFAGADEWRRGCPRQAQTIQL